VIPFPGGSACGPLRCLGRKGQLCKRFLHEYPGIINEEIIRHAKRRAAEEQRSLSEVVQGALVSYLRDKVLDPKKREKACQIFCERPIRLSKNQFKHILGEIP
jgi:hypothetical protein